MVRLDLIELVMNIYKYKSNVTEIAKSIRDNKFKQFGHVERRNNKNEVVEKIGEMRVKVFYFTFFSPNKKKIKFISKNMCCR